MNKGKYNMGDYIIFLLSLVFIIIIIYIFFKSIYARMNYIPKNSVNVSPITGERITEVSSTNPIEVTYNSMESNSFHGISEADIIYEILQDNKSSYKGLFYNNEPKHNYPITKIDNVSLKSVPKFRFKDILDIQSSYSTKAEIIFVNKNMTNSSNFIYEDGLYYHYKNNIKDVDVKNNTPIAVSNIIIQFVGKDDNLGEGLLFCGGRVAKITWEASKGNPVKITDEKGDIAFFMKGKTWWIISNNPASVVYK